MYKAEILNNITQAAKEEKYKNKLNNLDSEMEAAAEKGETFVYWDANQYGVLKTIDRYAFVDAGFEVIELHDGISNGYKIDWER